ncbi:hypothetical protein GCK72_008373 [Caenorhabditis remanei]|uniref:Uncharacterized protein n=1 Tax=Caenorhabditis remanei TaxID=31234 RepID=A0A6A5GYG6_CAERE|nr:hypothetical protein GCK72_008373 [Caenorhabditis remanei]KAF1760127.1 hypothetical protein GCK72_008373 [Caenorhabditis remanei]
MLDDKTDDVEPVTTSASNKQETPQTTPARQLKHYEAGLEFRKLWNSVRKEDRSEFLIYIQLVSKHEEEKIEKEELERRRAHLKDESKEFQEMHEKKLLKCLGRYRSYVNRCHRLSGYRPNLKWQSTAEIEDELEGYYRLEQFDEFWKRLRKMESKISEMECFYFPYQIYFHEEDVVEFFVKKWNGLKKAVGNAKISVCN